MSSDDEPYFSIQTPQARLEVYDEDNVDDAVFEAAGRLLDAVDARQDGSTVENSTQNPDGTQDDQTEDADDGAETVSDGGAVAEPDTVENSTQNPDETQDPGDADGDYWCGRCGDGPMSEQGVAIHNGRKHEGGACVLAYEPDAEELEDVEEPRGGDLDALFDDSASLPDGLDEGTVFNVCAHYDSISDAADDLELDRRSLRVVLMNRGIWGDGGEDEVTLRDEEQLGVRLPADIEIEAFDEAVADADSPTELLKQFNSLDRSAVKPCVRATGRDPNEVFL